MSGEAQTTSQSKIEIMHCCDSYHPINMFQVMSELKTVITSTPRLWCCSQFETFMTILTSIVNSPSTSCFTVNNLHRIKSTKNKKRVVRTFSTTCKKLSRNAHDKHHSWINYLIRVKHIVVWRKTTKGWRQMRSMKKCKFEMFLSVVFMQNTERQRSWEAESNDNKFIHVWSFI